jgi:hypothetical protein
MINIVCVLRSNGKIGYDASWVEKLQNAVSRHLTLPHRFICLSDCDVPCERIPLEDVGQGWWAKMQLFRPNIFNGPVLYFDLDTVICKNINDIIKLVEHEKFVMWYEADKKIHSSAMMWWNGDYSFLWDKYISKSTEFWSEKYKEVPLLGDQGFVSENTSHTLFTDIVPKEWFHISHKHDCETTDFSKVKILHFRKANNKPSNLSSHPLVRDHWK